MIRSLLARFALVAFLVALPAIAGCSRTSTGNGRAGNAWTHHGLLRIANLGDPDTLDPEVGNEQIDVDLAMLWGGTFFMYDDKNEYVPELATVIPTLRNGGISKDGLTVVYHLRPGVQWQDGAPFTAADVVFTWHSIMNKANNIGSTVGYDDVRAIDVRDPHTIAVHLKRRYAPFVSTFFAPSSSTNPVLPAHLLAKYADINRVPFNSAPVGTGPFIVDRWQRGSRIVFRANPHYWRGKPKLDEIWYTPVGDENTIATLLASHEADLEFNGAASNVRQLSHLDGFTTVVSPFNEFHQLALNTHSPVLSDVRVRRALWYAFDSAGAVADITHGVDTIGYTDQPDFSWAYDRKAKHYSYDPAKARALLDAAGWKPGADGIRVKDGHRMQLTIASTAGSATGNAISVFAQRNWHDVGIDVALKTYSASLYFAAEGAGGILQSDKFDVAFFAFFNGVDPDESNLVMCDQFPPRGQNVYQICDPRIDAGEHAALENSDPAVRKSAYDAIQAAEADDVPFIVTWFDRRVSVQNTDLQNYRPAHAVSNWWNSYEWKI